MIPCKSLLFVHILCLLPSHATLNQSCHGGDKPTTANSQSLLQHKKVVNENTLLQSRLQSKAVAPTSAFNEIALVVHCRADPAVCLKRKEIMYGWKSTFKSVLLMISQKDSGSIGESGVAPQWGTTPIFCDPGTGDPYLCMADLMSGPLLANHRGVLYMHFDAVLNPCKMAELFDGSRVGSFSFAEQFRRNTIAELDACSCNGNFDGCNSDCLWFYWDGTTGARWRSAMADIHKQVPSLQTGWNDDVVFSGAHDFFYVPIEGFAFYQQLAVIFAKHDIFHEQAGPTILKLVAVATVKEPQDFKCYGNCCADVSEKVSRCRNFTCGHKINLQDEFVRQHVIKLQRSSCGSAVQLLAEHSLHMEFLNNIGPDDGLALASTTQTGRNDSHALASISSTAWIKECSERLYK